MAAPPHGSRKNGKAGADEAKLPERAGFWRFRGACGATTSLSDACGRRRGSEGRRAACTTRTVCLRTRASLWRLPLVSFRLRSSAIPQRDACARLNIFVTARSHSAEGVACAPRGMNSLKARARSASRRRTNSYLQPAVWQQAHTFHGGIDAVVVGGAPNHGIGVDECV